MLSLLTRYASRVAILDAIAVELLYPLRTIVWRQSLQYQ